MKENIKPCPYCGGEAEINHFDHIDNWLYEVRCPYCGCGTDGCEEKSEAIEAWNRRADRWIAVTDKMPETGDAVLAYIRHDREVYGCHDDGFRAYRVYEYDGHFIGMGNLCEVTHWMPLPEPPLGEIV